MIKKRNTGLKDIHGNYIYERDTVLFTFFYYADVEIETQKEGKILYRRGKPYFYDGHEYFLSDLNFDSESQIEIIRRARK